MDKHDNLVNELVQLLQGGSAHADLEKAISDIPANLRGAKVDNVPYTIWQLLEHIRIAQWDMLEFSKDGAHQSPNWPDDYWVKEAAPANDAAWDKSVAQIKNDQAEFTELLKSEDIYAPIPHGTGQSILKEALQMADHTAYHIAEIIMLRRVLGNWKS